MNKFYLFNTVQLNNFLKYFLQRFIKYLKKLQK